MRAFVLRTATLVVCVAMASLYVLADVVTMKNGDRLTGTVVRSDDKTVVVKTEYAGEVTVKWEAIASLTAPEPLVVTSKTGQVLSGAIEVGSENVEVTNKETGHTTLARSAVATVRSEAEQRLAQAWSGGVDVGFSAARGNSDLTNFNLAGNAARETLRDKTTVFVTSLFSRDTVNGVSQTTANAIRGGLRYDYNLSARAFLFAFTDMEHDRFQQLDLRDVLGGGAGWHARKTDRMTLDLNAGGSLDQDFFTGLTRRSGEALFGDELTFKAGSNTSLLQRLTFYPNLTDLGQYRFAFDLGATTRINQRLAWQIGLSDRTISDPLPGTKKNDLLLTTGIRVAFGKTKL